MLLNGLPEEVLFLVLEKCTAQELSALAQTCSSFANLVQVDIIWKKLCKKNYNIEKLGEIKSYHTLYSQLLHRHGWMLGLFYCLTSDNGGLLEVSYSNGVIQGIQVSKPLGSLNGPLVKTVMFQINVGNRDPNCVTESCSSHNAEISKTDDEHFVYTCRNLSFHNEISRFTYDNHMDIFKGITYKRLYIYNSVRNHKALSPVNNSTLSKLITPGIFVAQCNIEGMELVIFKFTEMFEIHGLKVAGDGSVINGKLSMKFDMKYPVNPSLEEQNSLETLRGMRVLQTENDTCVQVQRFIVPHRCFKLDIEIELPEMCKARYFGVCEVDSPRFNTPTYLKAHLVIFDTDLLGVLWLDLGVFIVYRRKEMD